MQVLGISGWEAGICIPWADGSDSDIDGATGLSDLYPYHTTQA